MRLSWDTLLNSERRRDSQSRAGEFRTEFERDYDRAVFSTPVRRLQDKAQVFPLEPHDAVRTRLTHSLEVSTVSRDLAGEAARWIAKVEGLQEEQRNAISTIAATCGLIHDIGNPPFGHAGEQAISSWFRKHYCGSTDESNGLDHFAATYGNDTNGHEPTQLASDFWHFEGNAQTLRLISKLQILQDMYGLNLTFGTLSALRKYIAPSDQINPNIQEWKKPGHFASENSVVQKIVNATGTDSVRNPITFLVEACDDIVYTVVDIEDGLRKGVIQWEQVEEAFKDCDYGKTIIEDVNNSTKGNFDGEVKVQYFRVFGIGAMVVSVLEVFRQRYEAIMTGEYHYELILDPECNAKPFVEECKRFAKRCVYTAKETLRLEVMGRQVIHELMDVFWEGVSASKKDGKVLLFPDKLYGMMSSNYKKAYEEAIKELPTLYCQRQLLTDYICGMTDTFACTLHKQLYNG